MKLWEFFIVLEQAGVTQQCCRIQSPEYKDTYFYILTCFLVLSHYIWPDTGRSFTGRWVGGSSFLVHWVGVSIRLFLKVVDVLISRQPPIHITFLMQTWGLKFTVLGDLGLSYFLEVAQVTSPKFCFASITCLTFAPSSWLWREMVFTPCKALVHPL